MKNNLKRQAQSTLASAALKTAKVSTEFICFFFAHQPKVPAALKKDK